MMKGAIKDDDLSMTGEIDGNAGSVQLAMVEGVDLQYPF